MLRKRRDWHRRCNIMNKQIITLILLTLLSTSALAQKHMRAEKIPGKSKGPDISIMVPKDWKVTSRSNGELQLKDSKGKFASFYILNRKNREDEEIFGLSHETVSEFRRRMPETTKEWKSGNTNYAVYLFSSRTTRTDRHNTIMSFDVWNSGYAVLGSRTLPRVVDLLEAQDWELIARSIKLK